ncbi:hypothetical protein M422DRAFT_36671 [Sphaerobolus stellatus SS14]|uniref:Uncharacterized protein n=1 Tax=Sphaerobolus stellatus (strain SS14) TaxID=990650 RepID=A0A0C9UYF7_SPHS4|nr:hypothetical protein M422DRAFT_36671 [Sphaerobolus stellatus SS14]
MAHRIIGHRQKVGILRFRFLASEAAAESNISLLRRWYYFSSFMNLEIKTRGGRRFRGLRPNDSIR